MRGLISWTLGKGGKLKSWQQTINVLAMADQDDEYSQHVVINLVDDAVVTGADAQVTGMAFDFLASRRAGFNRKAIDTGNNVCLLVARNFPELSSCLGREVYPVGHTLAAQLSLHIIP